MKFLLSSLLLFFVGCSAVHPVPTVTIQKLPVVRVGDPVPREGDYIIYYPVGTLFPLQLQTKGTLFASQNEIQTFVALSKELYLYKYWASHDGTTWKNSHELLNVGFSGGFDISGLQVNIKLETKEEK
ncbi:MAG: hypothetical protein AB7U44_09895 [Sulfuricurvum sp.]